MGKVNHSSSMFDTRYSVTIDSSCDWRLLQ